MSDPIWHEGGCFCGDVRYRVRGPAVWKAGCTCQFCVRIQAAPYVVWAGFDRDNFELIRGTPTDFRSSMHVLRQFCPRCGSTLTYAKEARGVAELEAAARIVYIAVPGLDDPTLYPPDEVIHFRERVPWLHLAGEIPLRERLSAENNHLQFSGIASAKSTPPDMGGNPPRG